LIVSNPDPLRGNLSLDRIERLAPQLARDIAQCIQRYRLSPERWAIRPASVRTFLSRFIPVFEKLMMEVVATVHDQIEVHGLDALHSESVWAELEGAAYRLFKNQKEIAPICRTLQFCASIHFDAPDIRPPGQLVLRFGHTDVYRLYRISVPFLLEYKRLLRVIDARPTSVATAQHIKHFTYVVFERLMKSDEIRESLRLHGFSAFWTSPICFAATMEKDGQRYRLAIQALLAEYDPVHWGPRTIELFGHLDMSALYARSPTIYEELRMYAATLALRPLNGRRKLTVKDSLGRVKRAVLDILDVLPPANAIDLSMRGLQSLVMNDSAALFYLYQHTTCRREYLTAVRAVTDALYPDSARPDEFFSPYRLAFSNPYEERPIYADYGPVRDVSIALYDEMVYLLAKHMASLDECTINATTLYHHFVQFRAGLQLVRTQLSETSLLLLRKHGMGAFDLQGGLLQKEIFAALQSAVRAGSVQTITAYGYRKSVEWFVTGQGFDVVGAYPTSVNRTLRHLKRLNTEDYYTEQQCREIAFHVEALLGVSNLSDESRLSLMIARILLKTSWTLSPTLGIQCDDIARVPSPLNPHGGIIVITQKPRAGYRSDAWSFSDIPRDAAALQNAAADLLLVRDEITASLRNRLPETNPYRKYIFIFERNGQVKRLSMNATKNVTAMLQRRGCLLTFDSKKIRKGGMNHVYRRLQRDLQGYEQTAGHSFETFESHYYRIDENQARYTLGRAVDVMGRYFAGKEISKEIVIVTSEDIDFQHTPTGECASLGNDAEAARYNRQHKKIHAQQGAEAQFCADFLSCVWCRFFRLVADPEHAWKLLSYREYVLFEMEISVVDSDGPDDQRMHVEILRARVSQILDRLDVVTPGVIAEGEALLRERGMHPDWAFALADAPRLDATNG
jgi:hypothetical protein